MEKMTMREVRRKKELTQEETAKMLGITKPTYYNYEMGKSKIPMVVFKTFCEKMGMGLDEVVIQ